MFVTVMATLAESLVMKYDYGTVNVLGGFLNLTESGTYPDNSEDFLRSFLSFVKYGTLCGDRFKPLYCLSNLMKSEQWLLVQALGFEDVISNTISCDRPIVRHGIPYNCAKDGIPACGSGLLSYWGAKMAGMKGDPRMFYEIEGDYIPHIPKHLIEGAKRNIDINQILDRILLPADKIKILKGKVLDK